jgi:phosphoglycerate dehydrogenase-like enzyme
MSRAVVVDFDALTAAVRNGRLRVATDVFPEEPLAPDHPIRTWRTPFFQHIGPAVWRKRSSRSAIWF